MENNNESEYNCEYDDIDMSKLKKNLMIQYRNINNNSSNKNSNNRSNVDKPKKRAIRRRGRAKKYQHISEEEYTEILKQQRREAAHRFYLKNSEQQIATSKKYYHDHRDEVLKKQLVYQKIKCVKNKISKIENSLELDNNQVCEILEIVGTKRIQVDELKRRLKQI